MKSFVTKHLPYSIALAFLMIAGSVHAQERRPDCFVLSAGVDNYPHVNKLQGCLNDAKNTTSAFQGQNGKLFGAVHATTLLDGQATHASLIQGINGLSKVGKAGDFVVIFLSGHGGRTKDQQNWYFLPHDYSGQQHARTALTDRQILDAADVLVKQNKKVIVIIDACFAGQLEVTARNYFQNYRNPQAGGLVLILSSSASQTSAALGQYSAFAKAFVDAMSAGDLNNDGKITLAEIRSYSHKRTHDLIREHNMNAKQDSLVAWSPAVSEHMSLALTQRPGNVANNNPQPPSQPASRVWSGNENLAGYGQLSFTFFAGGRVVMHDTAGVSEGAWAQNGSTVSLRFSNGRVHYHGTINGATMSGSAHNERTTWNWSVTDTVLVRN